MKVELSSPTLLKISWPLYDSAIDSEIRQRLATVPGVEVGRGRCCWAPAIQLWRLAELFPKASFDYAAMQAADRTGQTFYNSMVSMGVIFRIDPMLGVCVASEGCSPVIEQLVAERSHALKPFVEEAMKHSVPIVVTPAGPMPLLQGPLTQEDGVFQSWFTDVQGFAEKQREKVQYPRRKSRGKARKGVK